MIIRLRLPDGDEITADGDFATEATVRQLASILSGQSNGVINNLNDVRDSAGDLDNQFEDLDRTVKKTEKKFSDFSYKLERVSNNLTNKLSGLGERSTSFSDIIQNSGQALGQLSGKILGSIPVLGSAIGGVAEAGITLGTGALAGIVGFIEGLDNLNSKIFDAGLGINEGLSSFNRAARDAGIPLTEFTAGILENTDRLRLMSGSLSSNVQTIGKTIGIMQESNSETLKQLFAFGYETEDIIGAIADYSATARLAGKTLSPEQLASGTTDYLKNLRELSKITGTDIKSAKARKDALEAEASFQLYLTKLRPETALAVTDMLSSVDPMVANVVKQILTGKAIRDPAILTILNETPEIRRFVENMKGLADAGQIDSENVKTLTSQLGAVMEKGLTSYMNRVTSGNVGLMADLEAAGGTMSDILNLLGGLRQSAMKMKTEEKPTEDPGAISDALGSLKAFSTEVKSTLQGQFLKAVEKAAPMISSIGDDLKTYTQDFDKWLDKITVGIDEIFKPFFDAFKDKKSPSGGNDERGFFTRLYEGFTALYDKIYNGIVDGIYTGLSKFFGESSVGKWFLGGKSEDELKTQKLEDELRKLKDQLKPLAEERKTKRQEAGTDSKKLYDIEMGYMKKSAEIQTRIKEIQKELGQVPAYSSGGIVKAPMSGKLAKLHGHEAIIPLKNGNIPVEIEGLLNNLPDNMAAVLGSLSNQFDSSVLKEILSANHDLAMQNQTIIKYLETIAKNGDQLNTISRNNSIARA